MTGIDLPKHGMDRESLLARMKRARGEDADWQRGRTFSLVFYPGDEALQVLKEAYGLFFSENALNPSAFPSLRRFEQECVAMTASLLNGGEEAAGNLSSGGTESILLAMKTAREWGRDRLGVTEPEVVAPDTAHPAFDKAAHYLGMRVRRTPVADDYRADVDAMAGEIGPDTVLLVGSAPQYAQGVVDPIERIGALAADRGLLCHVDACIGGFMLPFVRRLGYPVPAFDLSVPGVTSISCDLHKYAYAAKGASVILYRDRALRRYQFYVHTDWPGGIYASPTLAGTRPGGAIAAAWAILNHLGDDGYMQIAREVMTTTRRLVEAVRATPGLTVLGEPEMSIFAIGDDGIDPYDLGDALQARGWHLDRQQFPASLHATVSRAHADVAEEFVDELERAARSCRRHRLRSNLERAGARLAGGMARWLPDSVVTRAARSATGGGGVPARSAPMYGMMAALPSRGALREVVLDVLDDMNSPPEHGGGDSAGSEKGR